MEKISLKDIENIAEEWFRKGAGMGYHPGKWGGHMHFVGKPEVEDELVKIGVDWGTTERPYTALDELEEKMEAKGCALHPATDIKAGRIYFDCGEVKP